MPSQAFTTVVPIGGTNPNLMTGSQFEFTARPTRVQVYAVRDVGGGAGVPNMEVFFGQELELSSSPLGNNSAAGVPPSTNDNLLIDDVAAPGDRLVLRLTETGGAAATTVRSLVILTPLG